jgi:PAS domain S-box-containing protein
MPAPEPDPPGDQRAERLAQALAELAEVQLELEQERLRGGETQALFDLVLGAMSDAVLLVDAPGRISRVNDATVRLTGRAESDLIGHTISELFEEGFPGTPWAVLARSPEGRLPSFEAVLGSNDRGPVPVSVSCSLLRDASGKVVGEVYAARDLSETQRLVHELEEAEAGWRLLAELGDILGREVDPKESLNEVCGWLARSIGAGAAVVLAQGPAVEHVVASPSQDVVAKQLDALLGRPPERSSALWAALHDHRVIHAPTLRPDFPLLSGEGAPEGVASAAVVPLVARDTRLGAVVVHASEPDQVSARVLSVVEVVAGRIALALANAQLREAVANFEAAEQATRFREELLAGVSHDMQTPLGVLLGSLQALQEGKQISPEHLSRLYDGMTRHALNLNRLVQQFLDYSRVEAGRPVALRPCPTDVTAVTARLQAGFGAGWRLQVDVPEDLPLAFVDPDRLEQVLANLVSNANKFSPPGSPISITATATEDTVQITVTDRGQGMSPTDLARAFEKFYRGTAASGVPGTGLGLYMSRVLVEAQGGRIVATSRPGEGSAFTVVLSRRSTSPDG